MMDERIAANRRVWDEWARINQDSALYDSAAFKAGETSLKPVELEEVGAVAGKSLLQAGLKNMVIYEKGDQVGGNWVYSPRLSHSSVFETTHIISSKRWSQYDDYPMPEDYPDYPSHKQLLAYFQGYADHFGVTPYIRFNTEVKKAEKQPGDMWKITLGDSTTEIFDYLMVANGHHWNPRWPQ